MHLQFAGCGDAFGSGGRFNTCFHLLGGGINALVDCGASSLVAMNKFAIDRNAVDVIFISHFHTDHIGGLPFFILEANYVRKRERPLIIAGPPGLKAHYSQWLALGFPGSERLELRFPLTLTELAIGTTSEIGRLRVTPFHVKHDDRAGPCLGFRFEAEQKIFAFSGDTEWTDVLVDVGRDADLFVCEAYTYDKPIATHMALTLLERHLPQIRPKRLILTHMSDDMLARRGKLGHETAEDGLIVKF
jgi:ribonuclease BN (tRNA processing enzyme)